MPKKKPVESKPGSHDATITITLNFPVHSEKAWERAAKILTATLDHTDQKEFTLKLLEFVEAEGSKARAASDWPREFSREQIRNWIEEATGRGLSVDDPLPDTLAATAQALGLLPYQLRIWIWDQPKPEWSGGALASWARARGFALCGHCGAPVSDPREHQCPQAPDREAEQ